MNPSSCFHPSKPIPLFRFFQNVRLRGAALLGAVGFAALPVIHAQQTVIANYMPAEIIILDLASGNRTLLSSDTQGTGPNFVQPVGMARESDGSIVVSEDVSPSKLYRIDVTTGNRTVISGDTVGTGPAMGNVYGLAVESDGNIIAADSANSIILRIDPTTGNRTILSSADVGSGPPLRGPFGLALDADGSIVFTAWNSESEIIRVDKTTGARTLVSSSTTDNLVGTGPALQNPVGIIRLSDGSYVVLNATGDDYLLRVDPSTGNRTVISSLTVGTGATISAIRYCISVDSAGMFYISDFYGNAVIKVDPTTGNRTLVASSELGTGPSLSYPLGMLSGAVTSISGPSLTVPDAPYIESATAGTHSVTVNFIAPSIDGGAPITGYTVTAWPGGITASGTSSPIVVTGLTGGTSYTFTVTATNSEGISAPSSVSSPVIAKSPQSITASVPTSKLSNDAAFDLTGSSNSGLPLTWTVVSGPAMINGSTVTLTGATGTVVVRADAAATSAYDASSSTFSFDVAQVGPLVYFGKSSEGADFAANIPEGSDVGTLLGQITQTDQFFILNFRVNSDRTITTTSLQLPGGSTTAADAAGALAVMPVRERALKSTAVSKPTAAAEPNYTFTGTLLNGELNFKIVELGVTLTGKVEPPAGSTLPIAGLYESSSLKSASGTILTIVGTTGDVYILSVTSSFLAAATGAISSDGSFTLTTADSNVFKGQVEAGSMTVAGQITQSTGEVDNFFGLATGTLRTDRLINLASRAQVTNDVATNLVTGFVIGGPANKAVLIRGIGPGLASYGVSNVQSDPTVRLFDSSGSLIAENDNWGGTTELAEAMARVGGFPLDAGSLDAAILTTLAPGPYTVQVVGTGESGVALAEIYDAAENPNSQYQRLVNISSRGSVTTGDGVLIGGFVITGNSPKRVLVRGAGPSLEAYGVRDALPNPTLQIFGSGSTLLARNDNWETPESVFAGQAVATAAEIKSANASVGAFAFATDSTDAAVIITLAPGAYTAHVGSANSAEGTALIEVYEIP